jgi:phage terminase large subunit-like protein
MPLQSLVERFENSPAKSKAATWWLVGGTWAQLFHNECEIWPHGRHTDQVDVAAGAFNRLAKSTAYSTNDPKRA